MKFLNFFAVALLLSPVVLLPYVATTSGYGQTQGVTGYGKTQEVMQYSAYTPGSAQESGTPTQGAPKSVSPTQGAPKFVPVEPISFALYVNFFAPIEIVTAAVQSIKNDSQRYVLAELGRALFATNKDLSKEERAMAAVKAEIKMDEKEKARLDKLLSPFTQKFQDIVQFLAYGPDSEETKEWINSYVNHLASYILDQKGFFVAMVPSAKWRAENLVQSLNSNLAGMIESLKKTVAEFPTDSAYDRSSKVFRQLKLVEEALSGIFDDLEGMMKK